MAKKYSLYYLKQYAKLKEYDKDLFEDIVAGLKEQGWKAEGGGIQFIILHKKGGTIKIYRNAESVEVIKVRFSAPPESDSQ